MEEDREKEPEGPHAISSASQALVLQSQSIDLPLRDIQTDRKWQVIGSWRPHVPSRKREQGTSV